MGFKARRIDPVRDIKSRLRSERWQALRDAGAARFPGARGRIPNFTGAEAAARRLADTDVFRAARRLKCNPDSPQRPVCYAALKAGKVVYMPAPRLRNELPFYELDPAVLGDGALWHASSIKGAAELGRKVALADMPDLDLIVTGCVGVTRAGARLGKGGGYSDLEYAMLREHGCVGEDTPIATTVHASQVLPDGDIPIMPHDITLDVIATDSELIDTERALPRPTGIQWDALDPDKRAAIPVLRRRKR